MGWDVEIHQKTIREDDCKNHGSVSYWWFKLYFPFPNFPWLTDSGKVYTGNLISVSPIRFCLGKSLVAKYSIVDILGIKAGRFLMVFSKEAPGKLKNTNRCFSRYFEIAHWDDLAAFLKNANYFHIFCILIVIWWKELMQWSLSRRYEDWMHLDKLALSVQWSMFNCLYRALTFWTQ